MPQGKQAQRSPIIYMESSLAKGHTLGAWPSGGGIYLPTLKAAWMQAPLEAGVRF